MIDNDIKRLEYNPKLNEYRQINTRYDSSSKLHDNIQETEYVEVEKIILPNNTEVVKVFASIDIADMVNAAVITISALEEELLRLRKKINNNSNYPELISAVANDNLTALDNYQAISENIDGDIAAEVYPYLYSIRNELDEFIDLINENLFDGLINKSRTEDFSETYKELVDSIISTDEYIEVEETGETSIDYKSLSIDAKLNNLARNRLNNLIVFAKGLIGISSAEEVNAFLPQESIFTNSYFHEILKLYNEDRLKMTLFNPYELISKLLPKIVELKEKVISNRSALLNTTRREFFYSVQVAKELELRLDEMILDLYKIDLSDSINKDDFLNTLYQKEQVRRHIKSLNS